MFEKITGTISSSKQALVLHFNIHSIRPYFHREGFQVKALSAYVPAAFRAEFIAVNWTNDMAIDIKITLGKDAAGMGAFLGTGMEGIVVKGQADGLAGYGYFR